MSVPDEEDMRLGDTFEFACRYDVFGPPNGCQGDCEGTGVIPHAEYLRQPHMDAVRVAMNEDTPPIYRVLWFLMEAVKPSNAWPATEDDSYHFIPCPDCRPDDRLVRLAWQLMGQNSVPR